MSPDVLYNEAASESLEQLRDEVGTREIQKNKIKLET